MQDARKIRRGVFDRESMNPIRLPSARPERAPVALEFASRPTNDLMALEPGLYAVGSSPACAIHVASPGLPRVLATLEVRPSGTVFLRAHERERVFVNAKVHASGLVRKDAIVHVGDDVIVLHAVAASERVEALPMAGLRGRSEPMRALARLVALYATMDVPVLIHGPSGTGKDAVAAALHRGGTTERPFVVANVAAIPRDLCESELFGHARGAFTGADRDHPGLLAQANGGTLFLDEIGELPLDVQPKLLRALDGYGVRAVGARNMIRPQVRIVTASHVDLRTAVAEGRFRHDLLHRLEVLVVETPPLRARPTDIAAIALGILASEAARVRHAVLTPRALLALTRMPWEGNVRELRNVLMRAAIASPLGRIDVDELRRASARTMPSVPADASGSKVLALLRRMGGNKSSAARAARMPRTTFRRKVNEALLEEAKGARSKSTARRRRGRADEAPMRSEVAGKPDDLLAAQ
jgi:transcriptional regulator of acetoin/glycerol metabolism